MSRTTTQPPRTLLIDRDAREVTIDGVPIHLTNAEFTLLAVLSQNPRRALSSAYLTQVITNSEWVTETHALHVYVSRLRRKMGESGDNPRWLVTVHGFGYRFEPERDANLAAALTSNRTAPSLDGNDPSGFILADADRTILWASDSMSTLVGWQPTELEGMTVYQLIHDDDRQHAMASRTETDAGLPAAMIIQLRTSLGEFRKVEALVRPVIGPDGKALTFLGEFRPVSTVAPTFTEAPRPIHVKRTNDRGDRP